MNHSVVRTEHVERVDEVSAAYTPAVKLDHVGKILFWVTVPFSIAVLFPAAFTDAFNSVFKTGFLLLSIAMGVVHLVVKFWLLPNAEHIRRKQLLTDAFGVPLTTKTTLKYYNNGFPPSCERLAANTMENCFFGKEIASKMLAVERIKIAIWFGVWMLILVVRHDSLDVVVWITQLIFSAEVLSSYLGLELLRVEHARTFDELYAQFVHQYHASNQTKGVTATLSSFADYESTKSRFGIMLSTKTFEENNERLTAEWARICSTLDLPSETQEIVPPIENQTEVV